MYEKIHSVIHIEKNLLIVGYNSSKKWQFRAVNGEGKIVQENAHFATAEEAFSLGEQWIKNNL